MVVEVEDILASKGKNVLQRRAERRDMVVVVIVKQAKGADNHSVR